MPVRGIFHKSHSGGGGAVRCHIQCSFPLYHYSTLQCEAHWKTLTRPAIRHKAHRGVLTDAVVARSLDQAWQSVRTDPSKVYWCLLVRPNLALHLQLLTGIASRVLLPTKTASAAKPDARVTHCSYGSGGAASDQHPGPEGRYPSAHCTPSTGCLLQRPQAWH